MPYDKPQTALVLLSAWQASQIEFWRPTAYVGHDVSNYGRVRSWWAGRPKKLTSQFKVLRPTLNPDGYFVVGIFNRTIRVHRLVVDAFLPPVSSLPLTNHKSLVRCDNRLGNLERIDDAGNGAHARANRDIAYALGTDNGKAVLTPEKVKQIRRMRKQGAFCKDIAVAVQASRQAVTEVLLGHTWRHV